MTRAALAVAAVLGLLGWTQGTARGETAELLGRPGAIHDDSVRYRLPFSLIVPRFLSQGPFGEQSHHNVWDLHAYDFVMPIGSQVRAARAGRVVDVVDGFPPGGHSDGRDSNAVFVQHDDGTFAVYAHLQRGIPVRAGELVEVGAPLGLSGMSGSPKGPHLHFVVRRIDALGKYRAVPIKFGHRGSPSFEPQMGEFYGRVVPTNAELEVRMGDRILPPDAPVSWSPGASARLSITLIRKDGSRSDVSEHPRTRIDSMTPWTIDVGPGPQIHARRAKGYKELDIDVPIAIAQILHLDTDAGTRARAVISFEIHE